MKEFWFDPQHHWKSAANFAELAQQAATDEAREQFERRLKASELLAKNAEYLKLMDALLTHLHGRSPLITNRIQRIMDMIEDSESNATPMPSA